MKLSSAQVKGLMAMGDMGLKGKFGVWMSLPPVNGRSLTVLERLELVERRDTDGMWRLTITGAAEYNRLCGEACTAIAAECAAKMAADDQAATERAASLPAQVFAEVMTSLEMEAPVTEESVSWQAVRVRDALAFGNSGYETERARLLDMLSVLYPTLTPWRVFDAWINRGYTITEIAGMMLVTINPDGEIVSHGFSGHSRRPMECRVCGMHASEHRTFVPNDGSSEAMWRKAMTAAPRPEPIQSVGAASDTCVKHPGGYNIPGVAVCIGCEDDGTQTMNGPIAPEPAQSVGTPWKSSKGKYGRHSRAWRG